MAAAQAGHTATLSLLLADAACDQPTRDACDAAGANALMLAARGGHASAIKTLVSAGCAAHEVWRENFSAQVE